MFMELRNEVNHLLYLYFNSVGVIQRDYGREGIVGQVEEMQEEIRKSKDRIYGFLDQAHRKAGMVQNHPDRNNLGDGLAFVDWCMQHSLEQGSADYNDRFSR